MHVNIKQKKWHLYIIRTVDNFLYTGISTDVKHRFKEHISGRACSAKYFKGHKPKKIVFSCSIGTHSLALKVEYRLKKLTRISKEKIISSKKLNFCRTTGKIEK